VTDSKDFSRLLLSWFDRVIVGLVPQPTQKDGRIIRIPWCGRKGCRWGSTRKMRSGNNLNFAQIFLASSRLLIICLLHWGCVECILVFRCRFYGRFRLEKREWQRRRIVLAELQSIVIWSTSLYLVRRRREATQDLVITTICFICRLIRRIGRTPRQASEENGKRQIRRVKTIEFGREATQGLVTTTISFIRRLIRRIRRKTRQAS